jgi:hypothetical protein
MFVGNGVRHSMVWEHPTCFNYRDIIPPGQANYVRFAGADIVYYSRVVVNAVLCGYL